MESAFTRGHGYPGEGISRKAHEHARNLLPGNCPCMPCLWKAMALHTQILLLKQEIANPATTAWHRNAMAVKHQILTDEKDREEATAARARSRAMAARQPLSGGGYGLNGDMLEKMGMFGTWLLNDDDPFDLASRNNGMPKPDGTESPLIPPEYFDKELDTAMQSYMQAAKKRRLAVKEEQDAMDVMHSQFEAASEGRKAKK